MAAPSRRAAPDTAEPWAPPVTPEKPAGSEPPTASAVPHQDRRSALVRGWWPRRRAASGRGRWRLPGLGLHGKLALAVAAVAALVAALVGVLVHAETDRNQLETARQDLDERLLAAVADHERRVDGGVLVDPPDLPEPLHAEVTEAPVRATYLDRSGGEPVLWAATVPRSPGNEPDTDPAEEGAPRGGAVRSSVVGPWPQTMGGDGAVLAVRESYAPQAEALAALDRTLLGAGLVAAALGSVLGLVLATVGGRRISRSVRTAQRIAGGDLTARVWPRGNDEIARMGTALNTVAEALGARLEAERRITADIAHELRTPVAGLVTAAELLPPGRPTELVQDRARTLRRLVEDVLEVARLDTDGAERPAYEVCRTATLARRAVAAWTEQLPAETAGADVAVELVLHEDAEVRTDPRRVARILANLLANAARHGAGPVQLVVAGRTLRVRDRGPGFPVALLRDGPQRFQTGARERGTGTGLGLTIVTGQARVLGATVRWGNPSGGGAETTVELPG